MLHLIRELLPILSTVVISFACGYAIRDLISRRRHAAERKAFYKRHPEIQADFTAELLDLLSKPEDK